MSSQTPHVLVCVFARVIMFQELEKPTAWKSQLELQHHLKTFHRLDLREENTLSLK